MNKTVADNIVWRRATLNDAKYFYDLRNDDEVRKNSFTSDYIDYETHINWFKEALINPKRFLYAAETFDGKFAAQARFDEAKDEFLKKQNIYVVSFALSKFMRGCGMSSDILSKACDMFFSEHEKSILCAEIKPDNIKSAKCFAKAGFAKFKEFDDRIIFVLS